MAKSTVVDLRQISRNGKTLIRLVHNDKTYWFNQDGLISDESKLDKKLQKELEDTALVSLDNVYDPWLDFYGFSSLFEGLHRFTRELDRVLGKIDSRGSNSHTKELAV